MALYPVGQTPATTGQANDPLATQSYVTGLTNSLSSVSSNTASVLPYTGMVATRCVFPNNYLLAANAKQTFSRVRHVATENLTTVQFVYCITQLNGSTTPAVVETYAGASATVTAGFEYNGVVTQVLFNGSPTGTVPVLGVLISDPITLPTPIPRGTTFYSRTWQNNSWGIVFANSMVAVNNLSGLNSSGEYFTFGQTVTDYTNTTTNPGTNAASGFFGPTAIISQTTRPTFMLVGDSRMYGSGDVNYGSQNSYGGWGNTLRWMVKRFACLNTATVADRWQIMAGNGSTLSGVAITGSAGQFSCTASSYPLVNGQLVTISGTIGGTGSISGYTTPSVYKISTTNGSTTFTLTDVFGNAISTTAGTPTGLTYTISTWYVRALFTPYFSHAVTQLGINDLTQGVTVANTISYLYSFCKKYLPGKPIFQTTLEPVTTSTDLWTTTANQTLVANNTLRIQFNDAVRQGLQYPVVGYIENANQVETSINSGIWKTISRSVSDGAITATSGTLTSSTANFSWDDLGKSIVIAGAGAAGANAIYTISAFTNTSTVTVTPVAQTSVSGATVNWIVTYDGTHGTKDSNETIEFSNAYDGLSYLFS